MTTPVILGQPHRAERSLFTPDALAILDAQMQPAAQAITEAEAVQQLAAPAVVQLVTAVTLPSSLPGQTQRFADCSGNNPRPNLAAYKASGRKSIAIKATEGTGYTYYAGNDDHQFAHAQGLTVDRYHWTRPDSGSAVEQAQHFWAATHGLWKPGDGWFADWETSYNYSTGHPVADPPDATWAAFMLAFQAEVARLAKRDLGFLLTGRLYTGNWYLDGKPAMQRAARTWPVILSDYTGILPVNNRYGLNLAAHQYTSRETVAGFGAPLDDNYRIAWAEHSGPRPTRDLLEEIMSLNRNSADYKALMDDVQDRAEKGAAAALDALPGAYGKPHGFTWWLAHLPANRRSWLRKAAAERGDSKGGRK